MTRPDLEAVLEHLDGARRYGDYASALCPFHDDSKPSLLVFSTGRFLCLGCGRKGWHDELIGKRRRRVGMTLRPTLPPEFPSDMEALYHLAYNANADLKKSPDLAWYLRLRGVDGLIDSAMLGWYEHWYTIPIFTEGNKLRGLIARASPQEEQATGDRFTQPEGQSAMLYVPDWKLVHDRPGLFVVFGIFDALALVACRFPAVTTTSGKDSFRPEWLDGYRGSITIIPDEGEETEARLLASKLSWRGRVLIMDYPKGCKDPSDMLRVRGPKGLAAALSR